MKLYMITVYYINGDANSYVEWGCDRLHATDRALGGKPLLGVDKITVEEFE